MSQAKDSKDEVTGPVYRFLLFSLLPPPVAKGGLPERVLQRLQ